MIAERVPAASELDPDQHASYLALCADVATIVAVPGLPRAARDEGRAVIRAYARALALSVPERWRAYHRAVAALLASCADAAKHALDFAAVAACVRLRAFLHENIDLARSRPSTSGLDKSRLS